MVRFRDREGRPHVREPLGKQSSAHRYKDASGALRQRLPSPQRGNHQADRLSAEAQAMMVLPYWHLSDLVQGKPQFSQSRSLRPGGHTYDRVTSSSGIPRQWTFPRTPEHRHSSSSVRSTAPWWRLYLGTSKSRVDES